jgi:hypothetical protein
MLYRPHLEPREPRVENHGIFAHHDQRCAVYSGQSAVLELGEGVFHPSWKAQSDGWQLVHADTRFKRWLVRAFLRRGV